MPGSCGNSSPRWRGGSGRRPAGPRTRGRPGGQRPGPARTARRAHLRYDGTDTALPVPLGGVAEMVASFEQAYRQHFSFLMRGKTILVEAVSVELVAASAALAAQRPGGQPPDGTARGRPPGRGQAGGAVATVAMYVAGAQANVSLVRLRDPPARAPGVEPA